MVAVLSVFSSVPQVPALFQHERSRHGRPGGMGELAQLISAHTLFQSLASYSVTRSSQCLNSSVSAVADLTRVALRYCRPTRHSKLVMVANSLWTHGGIRLFSIRLQQHYHIWQSLSPHLPPRWLGEDNVGAERDSVFIFRVL